MAGSGAAAGLTNANWQSGSAMSPIVVGQVYATSHSFSMALLTLAIGPLCGAILVLFVTQSRAPNVLPLSAVKAQQC